LQARYFLCVIRIRFHQRAEVARVRGGGGGGDGAGGEAEAVDLDTNAARAERWRGVLTTALEQMAFLFEFTGNGQSAVKKFGVNMWENIRLSKAAALAAAGGGKGGGGSGGGRGKGGKGGRGRGRGRLAKRAEDDEAAVVEPVEPVVEEESDVAKEATVTMTTAAAAVEEESDVAKDTTMTVTTAAAAMEESGEVPWWRVSDFKVSERDSTGLISLLVESLPSARKAGVHAGSFDQGTTKLADECDVDGVWWTWRLQAIGSTQSSRKYMASVRKVTLTMTAALALTLTARGALSTAPFTPSALCCAHYSLFCVVLHSF
jgi:hypothetical protein